MSKIHTSLSNTFDLAPEDVKVSGTELQVSQPVDTSVDNDADAVRDTLYKLLEQGSEAFEDLKRIAVAEESPRSFEVLNGMLSNLSDIATKIMEVHERKARIKKVTVQPVEQSSINNGTVTNNTVFVGTTAELHKIMKQMRLENNE